MIDRQASHVGALDQEEMTLSWSELTYTIPVKTKVDGKKQTTDRVIVNNLTGTVRVKHTHTAP